MCIKWVWQSVAGECLTGNGLQQHHEHFSAVGGHQFVHVTYVFVLAAPGSFRRQHGVHLLHCHYIQWQHSQALIVNITQRCSNALSTLLFFSTVSHFWRTVLSSRRWRRPGRTVGYDRLPRSSFSNCSTSSTKWQKRVSSYRSLRASLATFSWTRDNRPLQSSTYTNTDRNVWDLQLFKTSQASM